ncbi:MAG: choice-of-anchor J domain-containing protein, partial [Chitinophagales bacterium]|nr:choice-of-anchor J domain-containing protein [Chitinophagales bacterium]
MKNQHVHSIVHIAGTPGGVYYCTNQSVYYRNDTMPDWVLDNAGLPVFFNSNIARPFYRDGKIRIASYGKGIWESPLHESPARPIARITVDKLRHDVYCKNDSFYFDDYSFLNHQGASWLWSFQNGIPATSALRNPVVYFTAAGNHQVKLTVTDANGNKSSDSLWIQIINQPFPTVINEGFEGGVFPPPAWYITDGGISGAWRYTDSIGAYGQSQHSALFSNYDYDSQGSYDDMRFYFNSQNLVTANINFDVAYTYWGPGYTDTLEVLVSADCGENFTPVFRKGGEALATAPATQDFFVPKANEWRTENISLHNYLQQSELVIAFRNIGRWGNNLYIDNVNLSGVVSAQPLPLSEHIKIYPNPVSPGQTITVTLPDYAQGDV